MDKRKLLHSLRVVAAFALLGTVTAGAFFSWVPAIGVLGAHEIGALVGAAIGFGANAKHLA